MLNKIAFVALFLLFANSTFAVQQEAESSTKIFRSYRPSVGQPHPDFVLPSIEDGENIQLSDYRGKKVLLLHFASW